MRITLAPGRALFFALIGVALPASLHAQRDPLDAYDRYRQPVRPGILWTELTLSTVYDTNIEQNGTYLEGPGLIGDVHAQLRTSTRLPLLRIDYFGRIQQFRASKSWNRDTHSVLVSLEKRVGPVGIEAMGSWQANNQTEDREIADAYFVSPRLSLRLGDHRLRVYGRHWGRDFEEDGREETIRTVGGDIRLRPFDPIELELGARRENGDSDVARSRFVRTSFSARWSTRLGERATLVLEAERRVRTYPERWVELDGMNEPTRDLRWIPSAFLSLGSSPGAEVRLGYEYQVRSSNDLRREYDAHRILLSIRAPFIGWVRAPDS